MMRGFARVGDGWESRLETWEREYLAGLLDQVAALLVTGRQTPVPDGGTGSDPDADLDAGRGPGRLREGESDRDGDVLAALDFDPAGDARATSEASRVPATLAPVLDVLLPDASEDPEVALEVADLVRPQLRAMKHERLGVLAAELLEPTGTDGAVRVPGGREPEWLGALNDVRLVLAQRLHIDGPEAAEEVHAVAWQDAPDDEDDEARWRRGMALSYDMLTWWQESLVSVVLYD